MATTAPALARPLPGARRVSGASRRPAPPPPRRPFSRTAAASLDEHAGVVVDDALDGDDASPSRAPSREDPSAEALDAEARDLLQWPELSAQVRAFTATTLGARACAPALPLGASPEHSARLLAETTAAVRLRRAGGFRRDVFEGTRDIRAFVAGARRGRVLSGSSLADIATTCAACAAVWDSIDGATDPERRPGEDALDEDARILAPLRDLAAPLASIPEAIAPEIRRCLVIPGGNVADEASESLRAIREERRETERTLRAKLSDVARFLASKNFAERAQVVTRLGRECVPLKAGAQSEIDGVVLGASGSGATVFKEPADCVPLNNRLAELAAEEDAEVERVLRRLTALVVEGSASEAASEAAGSGRGADALERATEALANVDLAAARASHAEWLGASAPTLADPDDDDRAPALPGMRHPLLLEPSLAPLPRGGKVGAEETTQGWEEDGEVESDDESSESSESSAASASTVVPVDFVVPAGASLVAITGPNTGGKTASIKALGLGLLMARAGLHLPTDPGEEAVVPWTERVLADLGDAQTLDLEGGLSTFSAHLARLRSILRATRETNAARRGETNANASSRVVVLLDEPGGGTDPAEGAALAVAVLRASAKEARLTVATSHYEEVKALAGGTQTLLEEGEEANEGSGTTRVTRMEGAFNAAVEFDAETLRPTYRLLWGASGESNALAIARGLGLAPDLVDAATRRWERNKRSQSGGSSRGGGSGPSGSESLDAEAEELRAALEAERATQEARLAAARGALERAEALRAEVAERGAAMLDLRTRLFLEDAEERAAEALRGAAEALEAVDDIDALDDAARAFLPPGWDLDERGDAVVASAGAGARRAWTPSVGAVVVVRQLGGAEAEVVGVDEDAGEVVVRMGGITTRAPLAGVRPA